TFIFVTHDQEEALSMSDKVVVMADGRIQQIGTPVEIYNEPINAFVADFIGESNIVTGIMPRDYVVTFAGHSFQCEDAGFAPNEKVDVVVRPEDIDIVPLDQAMLTGEVTSVTFKGDYYEIIVDIDHFKWMIESTDRVNAGDIIGISIDPYDIPVMKRSEYSDTFGDYSSFSDEMDELSDPAPEEME
ncbi:MAG: ABC transporter ATP-binding protein, partial [Clostridia bacterium]|nr:ABC transporter ATP-binding protein [Clostridia bacterium]